jgi:hypothetical protein
MKTVRPNTLLVTKNAGLLDAASIAVPSYRLEWRETFAAALALLSPSTDLLVADATESSPMAHLLAALFVDQRGGRRAIVVSDACATLHHPTDERITVLNAPVTADMLIEAIQGRAAMPEWGGANLSAWEDTAPAEHADADLVLV